MLGKGPVGFKGLWLMSAYALVVMQMLLVMAVSIGAILPNCKSNSNCGASQYC